MRESFTVETTGRSLVDITARVQRVVEAANAARARGAAALDGLCTVFVHHTSASLLIQENADPAVRVDLEAFFSRLVTDGDALFTHRDEGPDDMSAHVRAALTAVSIAIPVADGRLDLGTWQALWLWEHRTAPHRRRISVVITA